MTSIGFPTENVSVTVLLPPCVMTISTKGSIRICGKNASPHMLSAKSYSSCNATEQCHYNPILLDSRKSLDAVKGVEIDSHPLPGNQNVCSICSERNEHLS
ncbi:hypothetical protein DERF_002302 [Dermatophagoides farinae]|uniref:Uncharacterized protein n=1 Tax=Dermatophagoides farinae TaxID=6954 RepID=A0A922IBC2_DERFA|nr:hypothetical protein DERF_002302 [Dermatophagoides farinae]